MMKKTFRWLPLLLSVIVLLSACAAEAPAGSQEPETQTAAATPEPIPEPDFGQILENATRIYFGRDVDTSQQIQQDGRYYYLCTQDQIKTWEDFCAYEKTIFSEALFDGYYGNLSHVETDAGLYLPIQSQGEGYIGIATYVTPTKESDTRWHLDIDALLPDQAPSPYIQDYYTAGIIYENGNWVFDADPDRFGLMTWPLSDCKIVDDPEVAQALAYLRGGVFEEGFRHVRDYNDNPVPARSWREAYLDAAFDYREGSSMGGFTLCDINGDDIPEFYFESGVHAYGEHLFTYGDGLLSKVTGSGFGNTVYIPGGNIVYTGNMYQGHGGSEISTIQDGRFYTLHSATQEVAYYEDEVYTWDGVEMDLEEYNQTLDSFIDLSRSKTLGHDDGLNLVSFQDILIAILDY